MRRFKLPPIPPLTTDPLEVACVIVLVAAVIVFIIHSHATWR